MRAFAGLIVSLVVAWPAWADPPAGYTLTFSDEFDGSSLDASKWAQCYIWGGGTVCRLNDEAETFSDNGTRVVSGGTLKLIAKKTSSGYESGMIRSYFSQKYGYFETRMKMPNFLGEWPSFWLAAQDQGWPPEVDILEAVNNGSDTMSRSYHVAHGGSPYNGSGSVVQNCPGYNSTWGYCDLPFDMSQDFHTYALLWTPTQIVYYIDGVAMVTRNWQWLHDNGTDGGPAHAIIDLAVGGSWAGRSGIDDSKLPAALEVDYVRIYSAGTITPPPPPPPPSAIGVGSRVSVNSDTLVYRKANQNKVVCTQADGAAGVIVGGPNRDRWDVDFDASCDGWVDAGRLQ